MSLYDVNSLSNTTSLSTTVLDAVISLPISICIDSTLQKAYE